MISVNIFVKVTLHVEGARVDSSRLSTRISSIVSGVLVTRCGGIHLNKHADRMQLVHNFYNNTLEHGYFTFLDKYRFPVQPQAS